MTEEDKNLLIQDLCARLPYGVKLQNINNIESIVKLRSIDLDNYCCEILFYTYQGKALTICDKSKLFRLGKILRYKPYLFPLSSMTEEQIEEAKTYFWKDVDYGKSLVDKGINCFYPCFNILEFYHKHHLDYRGLIPMGLAIDCTNLNVY